MSVPTPTPIPQQNQVDQDLAAWAAAQAQKQQMMDQLQALLAMLAAMKDPQEAFMICMNQVLPGVMQVQDAGEGALGYANFTDSDFQKEISAIQALFNELCNDGTNTEAATQLMQQIDQLEAQLKLELQKADSDPKSTPMDKEDLQTMINAIDGFKAMFKNDWDSDPTNVAKSINDWASDPTQMKIMLNAFQELNSSIGALSTATGTQIQVATENYKQILGTLQDVYKTWSQSVEAFIKNQNT